MSYLPGINQNLANNANKCRALESRCEGLETECSTLNKNILHVEAKQSSQFKDLRTQQDKTNLTVFQLSEWMSSLFPRDAADRTVPSVVDLEARFEEAIKAVDNKYAQAAREQHMKTEQTMQAMHAMKDGLVRKFALIEANHAADVKDLRDQLEKASPQAMQAMQAMKSGLVKKFALIEANHVADVKDLRDQLEKTNPQAMKEDLDAKVMEAKASLRAEISASREADNAQQAMQTMHIMQTMQAMQAFQAQMAASLEATTAQQAMQATTVEAVVKALQTMQVTKAEDVIPSSDEIPAIGTPVPSAPPMEDVFGRLAKVRIAKADSNAGQELPMSACTADFLNYLDTKDYWRENAKVVLEVADYKRRVAKVQTLEAYLKDKQAANQNNPEAASAVKAAFIKLNDNIDKRDKCREKCKALFAKHFPDMSVENVEAAISA